MQFFYRRTHNIVLFEPNHIISEGEVDIAVANRDGYTQIVGRAKIDLLDYSRVVNETDFSLYDVCDSDSEGWENIHKLLFDPETEDMHEEIQCPEAFDFLAFAYKLIILPEAKSHEPLVLYHLANMHGGGVVFMMYKELTSTSDSDLAKIGFRKVADSGLLFLPTMEETVKPDLDPLTIDLDPSIDYTEKLNAIWK